MESPADPGTEQAAIKKYLVVDRLKGEREARTGGDSTPQEEENARHRK